MSLAVTGSRRSPRPEPSPSADTGLLSRCSPNLCPTGAGAEAFPGTLNPLEQQQDPALNRCSTALFF